MKATNVLLLILAASSLSAQTRDVVFTVANDAAERDTIPKKLKAVVTKEWIAPTRLIRFYPRRTPFQIGDINGTLAWFSYTTPPKRHWIVHEADQPMYGALFDKGVLYVCSPDSPESTYSVVNMLLASHGPNPLSDQEALMMALLLVKCTGPQHVFSDPNGTSKTATEKMSGIATVPKVTNDNGAIRVNFYSFQFLPSGEITRWEVEFREGQISRVNREHVADTPP